MSENIDNVFGNSTEAMPGIKMEPALVNKPPAKIEVDTADVDKGPRVRIILERNADMPPTGQFFGANGIGTILKPNIPADVKPSIINILNTCVMSTPIIDPATLQITGFEDRLRFPYRILGHIPGETAVA